MNIGITLLFTFNKDNSVNGTLKSFVINCDGPKEIVIEAERKAKEQLVLYPDYKYWGIEDIFVVTGQPSEGELLGRTSFYDLNKNDASDLIREENEYSIKKKNVKQKLDLFNVQLIYYYCDEDDDKFSFPFSIMTLIESKEFIELKTKSLDIAVSTTFLEKIVNSSYEHMELNNIEFIGIEDVAFVEEDLEMGGAFYVLFNNEFDLFDEITNILLNQEEIKELSEAVFLEKRS